MANMPASDRDETRKDYKETVLTLYLKQDPNQADPDKIWYDEEDLVCDHILICKAVVTTFPVILSSLMKDKKVMEDIKSKVPADFKDYRVIHFLGWEGRNGPKKRAILGIDDIDHRFAKGD
ncbi:hypothetical protein MKZ38_003826 [Zalerion maritima]|uniref:Uncharacterized protein n=1 Tax=Zalerion maritima TaxID=339359 RepID=A0AAD5WRH4_9PEZI|nr:hypothetical protein MKZ38_003826 [Zalerion maritima]